MLSANINFLCKHFSLVLPKTHYTANSFSTFKDRFVSTKLKNQENTDAIPKFWICKLRKYILLLLSWKGVCGFIFLQSIALFSTCLKFVDHAEKPKNSLYRVEALTSVRNSRKNEIAGHTSVSAPNYSTHALPTRAKIETQRAILRVGFKMDFLPANYAEISHLIE